MRKGEEKNALGTTKMGCSVVLNISRSVMLFKQLEERCMAELFNLNIRASTRDKRHLIGLCVSYKFDVSDTMCHN